MGAGLGERNLSRRLKVESQFLPFIRHWLAADRRAGNVPFLAPDGRSG